MEGATSAMATVTAAISQVTTAIGTVFTTLTGNEYLVFFMAATVLGVGIRMFRKLRAAA